MNYSEFRFSEREVVYVKRRRNGEIIQLNSCEEWQCLIFTLLLCPFICLTECLTCASLEYIFI